MFRSITCTALLVGSSAAFGQSHSITLDVRDSAGGKDGYVDASSSTGGSYSCRYAGGDNNTGDVTISGRGSVATVVVHLTGGSRYAVDDVSFPEDPNSQLSRSSSPNSTTAIIKDKNSVAQTATYDISVSDSNGDKTFVCDPKIINN